MLEGPRLLPRSRGKTKKLVVLCHGYGSNGQDLLSLAHYWADLLPEVEFLAPNGPEVWETEASGYQWFSLKEFTPAYIRKGLKVAHLHLQTYLQEVMAERHLTPKDLALVGFSQGGMIALDMMFVIKELRGLICYSGGFFPPSTFSQLESYPEVFLVHGDADPVVPYEVFLESQRKLKKMGIHSQTLTCSHLGHSINEEGIKAGGKFLAKLLLQ